MEYCQSFLKVKKKKKNDFFLKFSEKLVKVRSRDQENGVQYDANETNVRDIGKDRNELWGTINEFK